MAHGFGVGFLSLTLALLVLSCSQALRIHSKTKTKSAVFLSPVFELEPGSVVNRIYYNIDFPRGHIALKRFHAEVVDEAGNPIPLHETYLHHWVVARYFYRKDAATTKDDGSIRNKYLSGRNSGICQKDVLGQYFGLGSETRRTSTYVPDPFGIELGNPAEIPKGYEERWMLNVHAIDTRGAEDKLGCTECQCHLYNVSKDEYGRPLSPDYIGGLNCCYDHTHCRVIQGFEGAKRSLFLRYTVEWIDWSDHIVPVRIYIFDVTDTPVALNDSKVDSYEHSCKVEYEVRESCKATGLTSHGCVDTKRTKLRLPTGGYVVYGVAHQHTGGIGSALYGEDGRVICSSFPIYGKGEEAGNEAGYIVGMSTCYPKPGSVKILDGETLVFESNYSNTKPHTGIMGLFYILVADKLPNPKLPLFSQL
ncbi:hypothetical protein UlMin_029177 [Ulmus minor]